MHVMVTVPFRVLFTGVISSMEINGVATLSDTIEVDTLEEFIIALWITIVVEEAFRVQGQPFPSVSTSISVNPQSHCMSLPDYLQYDIQKLLGREAVLQHLYTKKHTVYHDPLRYM